MSEKWSDQDLECARAMRLEGFSIRAISAELDIPYSTLRSKLSSKPSEPQRADPEGIDLLRARIEKLELLVKSLLPSATKSFNSFTKENIAEML